MKDLVTLFLVCYHWAFYIYTIILQLDFYMKCLPVPILAPMQASLLLHN